jgi:DmsE family decaheme c-type cytochrome
VAVFAFSGLLLLSAGIGYGAAAQQAAPAPPAAAAQAPPAAEAAAPADNKPATYVGSETCQTCHEDIFKAFQKSPHAVVEKDKRRKWDGKACESCHGPGSKHAESVAPADILNPARLKPAVTDRSCLKCHANQQAHAGRIRSGHARSEVSCVACHAVHKQGPNGLVVRGAAAVNGQCRNCHNDVWAAFQKPFRHRLPEGAMSCVDCHNPHGSFQPRNQTASFANERSCLRCHSDKRGPFLFEHAAVRQEGCGACHEAHGSANPRQLTRHEVRMVCLECHSNLPNTQSAQAGLVGGAPPPAFHDLRQAQYRNCTICHIKVHGSYVNRELLR